jgi:phospholipid/cholesterol/gamma-HCH transport system permease protein
MAAIETEGSATGWWSPLVPFGSFLTFSARVLMALPATVVHHWRTCLRHFSDICWGKGAIIVGGGTIGVMVLLSVSVGTSLGIEGFNGLELIGLAPLVGFISATANTRELGPLVAALALGAQVGCRFTAQLGAMRINEEVDALEVMSVRPVNYLVATRLVATMLAIVPLYAIGLLGSYLASEATVVMLFGQSAGQFDHYFLEFLSMRDIWFSLIKILVFAAVVVLIHCWYGMSVSAGSLNVGEATGRSIRASFVVVVVLNMLFTVAMWGGDPGFRISG